MKRREDNGIGSKEIEKLGRLEFKAIDGVNKDSAHIILGLSKWKPAAQDRETRFKPRNGKKLDGGTCKELKI